MEAKRTKKLPRWAAALLAVLGAGVLACVWEFVSSQNPYLLPVKRALKYDLLGLEPISQEKAAAGLEEGYALTWYADGRPPRTRRGRATKRRCMRTGR